MNLRPVRFVPSRHTVLGTFLVLALSAFVLTPTPAHAHGISGDAADLGTLGFVPLGVEHMLLGWDHLAFVAGVLLLARTARRSFKLISLFVLGHSTTLILATAAGWRVNAGLVDAVIAASVAVVGVVGIFGRPTRYHWLGAAVLGFGLVHGLGLATRFAELGIPPQGRLWKVVAFNVGIEVGQATAIFGFVVLAAFITSTRTWMADGQRAAKLIQLASAALFIGGSTTAALLAVNALTDGQDTPVATLSADTTCAIGDPDYSLPAAGGDHPAKAFYAPGEETPLADFGHTLGDGYVVVLYHPDLDPEAVTDLEKIVARTADRGVLAGPDGTLPETTTVRALHQRNTLRCADYDSADVRSFIGSWLGQPVAG